MWKSLFKKILSNDKSRKDGFCPQCNDFKHD